MASDELNQPLGLGKPARPAARRRMTLWVVLGLGGALPAIGIAASLLLANPHGGEPYAVAAIAPPNPAPAAAPSAPDPQATGSVHASAETRQTTGGLENGVTVFRAGAKPATGSGPGPMVIKVPDALGQSEIMPTNKRLIEMTRYGPLPKIAADGTRASDFYARPIVFNGVMRAGTPRVALVIGGLGLDPAATRDAIDHMPATVSLAFTPYADRLDDLARNAKAAGHEVLLQLPMEAFGESASRPGAHTLRAGASATETLDDMHWLMSRMTGYAGLVNGLGGKFTADKPAMSTMLQETSARGLFYVDDGRSKRSLGPALAPGLGVPSVRTDVVLDAAPDQASVRAALVKLEATARGKGSALGIASDIPGNLDVIAAFAATLEAKGIALVPVSSLTGTNPPAMAAVP